MSDTPPTTASTTPAAADKPAKPKKPRRTWKQRIKLTVLVLLILILAFRLALTLLLPTVVRRVAHAFDLDLTYKRIELTMLDGNAHIWGLTLRPKSGGDSIVVADYVQGNISPLNLFRGRLVVYRAEVDGVDMLIDREPDGTIPLLKKVLSPTAEKAPVAVATSKPSTSQALNLQPPLSVEAVRVSHVTTRLRDRSVSPVFDATVRTSLRLSDLGSMDRPARFELEVVADPVLDVLRVEGEAHSTPTAVDATMNVLLRGLHYKPAAGYLLPIGLKPVSENLTVRAKMTLKANTIPNTPDLAANVVVEGVSAVVDGQEWAALDKMTLDAKKLSASAAELGTLLVEGGRISAQRTAAGALRVAGLELVSTAPAAATTQPAVASPPATANASPSSFRLALGEIALKNLAANFNDQAVSPAGVLSARLDAMSVKNIVLDPAQPDAKATISAKASLPGVIRAITMSGSATPFAGNKRVDLKFDGSGIKPDALKPYLEQAGLESEFNDGKLTGAFAANLAIGADGKITASASGTSIKLEDGKELLSLASASASGVTFDPKANAITLPAIEVNGPGLLVRRISATDVSALGIRTIARSTTRPVTAVPATQATPATKVATTAPAAPSAPLVLPRVEVGKFSWKGIKLQFADEVSKPATVFSLSDAGVELSNLLFDPQAKADGKPGTFKAWLSTRGIAEQLQVEGTLTPRAGGIAIDSAVTGSKITGELLIPYLKPFGIQPVLTDGQLKMQAKAQVAQVGDGISASFDLANLVYSDGETELAGIDAMKLDTLTIKPAGIEVGEITIDRPRASVARNADGSLQAGGIRLISLPPATQATTQSAMQPATQPAVAFGPVVTAAPAPPSLRLEPLPIMLSLNGLHVREGTVQWTDRAMAKPVQTAITASVDLTNVQIGPKDAPPANLQVTAKVAGVIDSATVTGTLGTSPEAPSIKLDIAADGIRAGDLVAYLPPGVACTLKNGHLAATIDAGTSNHAAGGLAAHLSVAKVDFHDGSEPTLFKMDAMTLAAGRIDPAAGAIAIHEISTAGIEANVTMREGGVIEAGGVRLSPPPPANETAPAAAPTTAPAVPLHTFSDVNTIVAEARKPFPLITLAKLDLGLKRLTITGATGPSAAPVSLADVRLRNTSPIELGGTGAENRPLVKLELLGKVDPIVGQFAVRIEALPLATTPSLIIDVNASKIDGDGLTSVVPTLKPTIDGSPLKEGTFKMHLEATANYSRRGPRDFDFSRGILLDFSIKPIEYRATPDGPILAGLEEIRSEGIKIEPGKGNVRIKSLDIVKPIGRAMRDAKGIHAMGVVIVPPATQPTTGPASQPAPVEKTETVAAATAPSRPPQRPENEIRLDHLTVSGIDLVIEDQTSKPPTLIPLNGLDVDIRDLSNQMPFDGKPARFEALVTAAKVPLPPKKSSKLGLFNKSAATEPSESEMRELFSQIAVSGRVGIKQQGDKFMLDGWAKTAVNGFELTGVRGLAEPYEVKIGGGVFDDSNEFRFTSDRIETKNKLVFTNLSLSEPPNGPIQRTLKLSAPIDVTIGLLTDNDGSITMNLPVPIERGAVSAGAVLGPAVGALAQVLTTAIASAPLKAVGGVTDMLGIGGKKQAQAEPPVTVNFISGYTQLEGAQLATLQKLAERMKKERTLELQLRPDLSAGDVARAAVRANPPPEACREMIDQLRRQKAQLVERRSQLAAEARGQLGARPESEAKETLDSLKATEREISQVDIALDQLGDMLRPGSDRQADRRTRAASIEIARQRLRAVRDVLTSAGVEGTDQRVHDTNPQFAPTEAQEGGSVVIQLVPKKK